MGFKEIGEIIDAQIKCYAFKKFIQQIDHSEENMLSLSNFVEEKNYIPFNK